MLSSVFTSAFVIRTGKTNDTIEKGKATDTTKYNPLKFVFRNTLASLHFFEKRQYRDEKCEEKIIDDPELYASRGVRVIE